MEQGRKNMAPRIVAWLIVVAAVASPAGYVYFYEESIDVMVLELTTGRVEQTVTAISSGTVMASRASMVAAGTMGIVVAIHAVEGSRVEEGALLIEIDHRELDARTEQARASLEAARSRVKQAKLASEIFAEVSDAELRQAKERLSLARIDFDRVQKLSERQAVAQSRFDSLRSALRVAQEGLAAAQARQREKLLRLEEIESAVSLVKQSESTLVVAKAAREKAYVTAPFSGVVAKVFPAVAEAVAMNMPLVQLVQDDGYYVEAPFDEANISEIKLGQIARINVDSYRETDFWGEVAYISPVVTLNRDLSRTLSVRVIVKEEDSRKFVAGMSADVTLVVQQKENVLYVPSESLIRERFAYVVENGRAQRRDVKLGIGNWNTREVLSGLSQGETLITSVSIKELDDGVKVNIVDSLE